MKIGVAQTRPVRGSIESNIWHHKRFIEAAVFHAADMIVFPELSITGYEPTLAKDLATNAYDKRFDDFQKISDSNKITIGIGVPTKNDQGQCISIILFLANKERKVYSKKYLHVDEEAFFISGQNFACLKVNDVHIAPAICYEISVPAHAENAFKNGAEIYIASVAKTANGVEKACKTLPDIAKKYAAPVLMSNSVGWCEDGLCAGISSVWNSKGELVAQLDDTNEGILIFDTDTNELTANTIEVVSFK